MGFGGLVKKLQHNVQKGKHFEFTITVNSLSPCPSTNRCMAVHWQRGEKVGRPDVASRDE